MIRPNQPALKSSSTLLVYRQGWEHIVQTERIALLLLQALPEGQAHHQGPPVLSGQLLFLLSDHSPWSLPSRQSFFLALQELLLTRMDKYTSRCTRGDRK